MKTKRPSPAFGPAAQPINARPYHKLLSDVELEDAAITLESKRWMALEWMRAQGKDILNEEKEND